jgi:hypothetical protein
MQNPPSESTCKEQHCRHVRMDMNCQPDMHPACRIYMARVRYLLLSSARDFLRSITRNAGGSKTHSLHLADCAHQQNLVHWQLPCCRQHQHRQLEVQVHRRQAGRPTHSHDVHCDWSIHDCVHHWQRVVSGEFGHLGEPGRQKIAAGSWQPVVRSELATSVSGCEACEAWGRMKWIEGATNGCAELRVGY